MPKRKHIFEITKNEKAMITKQAVFIVLATLLISACTNKKAEEYQKMPEQPFHELQAKKVVPPLKAIELPGVPGAIPIAEVFEKADQFSNKEITVQGIVVKVNRDIMEKHWVHLLDGSTADRSDLTFSTVEDFQLGDTVLVKGTLAVNKDFGGGYVYPVILESGVQLTREP